MDDNRKRIACVGEVMLELALGRDAALCVNVGGDTYNTAVYLRRWLTDAEADIAYVTMLGTDPFSDLAVQKLVDESLIVSAVGRHRDRTIGLYGVSLDEGGERSFNYWRSGSAARKLFDSSQGPTLEGLDSYDLVYLSGITLAILCDDAGCGLMQWAKQFRQRGGLIAFDSNYRPALWPSRETAQEAVTEMWACCDIALPSLSDELALFGDRTELDVIDRIKSAGAVAGCLKRGDRDPIGFDTPEARFAGVLITDVVDTTAAGDSFNAGFIVAWLKGEAMLGCIHSGHLLASEVIRHRGAILPISQMPKAPWDLELCLTKGLSRG